MVDRNDEEPRLDDQVAEQLEEIVTETPAQRNERRLQELERLGVGELGSSRPRAVTRISS